MITILMTYTPVIALLHNHPHPHPHPHYPHTKSSLCVGGTDWTLQPSPDTSNPDLIFIGFSAVIIACHRRTSSPFKKKKTCAVFLSSYKNTSESLGRREMLWEHEPQASVSTAFSSSPKLSRVFL